MERKAPQTFSDETALDLLNEKGIVGPLADLRDDIPGEESDADSQEIDRLRAITSQVSGSDGEQGLISIWKKDEKTLRMVYVGETSPADFLAEGPQSFLAENFGSGEYEIKAYTPDRKLFKRPRATISKLAADFFAKKRAAAVPAVNLNGNNSDIAELAKVMASGFMQLGQLIARTQPAPQTRMELLAELGQMKAIFGGGGSDPIAMFSQLATIFKGMQPRAETGGVGDFIDLADRFMPVIAEAIKGNKAEGVNVPALPAPSPQPARPATAPTGPALTPEQQGKNAMSMQLKMQLVYLCGEALRDADPGPYAAIIAEKVPKEVLDALVNDGNWLDSLAKFHFRVKEFPEWFGELRELVMEELAQENLPETGKDATSSENLPGMDNVSESDESDT